jgi:AraC-like DNA-binding protein
MLRYAIQTEQVARIVRLLASVLDIPIAFFDIDHERLRSFDAGPDSAYCSTFRKEPLCNHACEVCDREHLVEARRRRSTLTYTCHNNLRETAVPLFDEESNYLGAIVFGQIRIPGMQPRHRPTAALQRLFEQLPAYPEREIRDIANLLSYFAQYMIQNHLVQVRPAPWADRVRQHVSEHLSEKLDLATLATAAGVSHSQISHAFQREMGMSAARYVRRERLRRARELLRQGRQVKEIAYSLGFCDEFHFSKVFKKEFGVSPKGWAQAL